MYSYGQYQIAMSGQNQLMHYGISGQKWGIRRFQNEDKSLTEEGKIRYARKLKRQELRDTQYRTQLNREKREGTKIPKRRKQLEEKYLKKGFTQEQAEMQALKRYKTEKIIKIAGAVALTTALAYGTYKAHQYIEQYGDKVIPKGTDIQRVTATPNDDTRLDRALFVTPDVEDTVKYRGLYGKQLQDQAFMKRDPLGSVQSPGVFTIEGKLNRDAKIAGEGTGKQVFENLLKNDPEFAAGVKNIKDINLGTKDAYDDFNQLLPYHGKEYDSIHEKFYKALKDKGYDGVIDVNDRRYSGYEAKRPTIMFGIKDKLANTKVKNLPMGQIRREHIEANELIYNQRIRKQSLSNVMNFLGQVTGYGSLITGVGVVATVANEVVSRRNAQRYRELVREYRREHPNSRLSDKKIIQNTLNNTTLF